MLNEVKSRFLSGKKIFTITIFTLGLITITNAQGITNTLGGNTASDKFVIVNKNSEAGLVVTGEGNVGIGNVTPSAELHVKGDKEIFRLESTSLGWLSIFNSSGYQGYLGTWNGADDIDVGTGSGNTTGKLHLVTQATPRMTIIANGNVGIGTTNPNVKLHVFADGSDEDAIYGESVEGSGVKGLHTHPSQTAPAVFGWNTGSGAGVYGLSTYDKGVVGSGGSGSYDFYAFGAGINYGAASSIRWKNNIVEIDNSLEKLAKLRGVYFDWDEEHGGQHDVGMIAEEVGKVLPEIVVYEENGIDADGMDYSKLTPLLVEAVKELQNIVENQQKEIEALKNK